MLKCIQNTNEEYIEMNFMHVQLVHLHFALIFVYTLSTALKPHGFSSFNGFHYKQMISSCIRTKVFRFERYDDDLYFSSEMSSWNILSCLRNNQFEELQFFLDILLLRKSSLDNFLLEYIFLSKETKRVYYYKNKSHKLQ